MKPNSTYCNECGYDLHGIPQQRCPECGTGFDLESVQHAANEHAQAGLGRVAKTMIGAAWSSAFASPVLYPSIVVVGPVAVLAILITYYYTRQTPPRVFDVSFYLPFGLLAVPLMSVLILVLPIASLTAASAITLLTWRVIFMRLKEPEHYHRNLKVPVQKKLSWHGPLAFFMQCLASALVCVAWFLP